jgi:K+-sensing histidine kinase KdpD
MKGDWTLPARRIAIPLATVGLAASLTWVLWPYIRPTVSPLFFVAVVASSMYGGLSAGLLATFLSSIATAYFFMEPTFSLRIGSTGDIFRLVVFAAVALLTNSIAAERNRAEADQRRLIEELTRANARIRTLADLLPLCPYCKRVNVASEWKSIEQYLSDTPDLQISLALCPDCSRRHLPEFQQKGVQP